jgi:imidazole glycerol-phosphate synthase subunit HisH
MIAVINSGIANISSVVFALERLQVSAIVTTDPQVIKQADKVILPGVGTARQAMENLKQLHLISVIKDLTQPVLGICLGMQLMYDYSEEGEVACLGILPGKIHKITGKDLIIPHMGWNTLDCKDSTGEYVYFVHSYCAPVNEYTVATTTYGETFTSIAKKNNFHAMQFHPERSGVVGEKLLKDFIQK